MSQVVHEPRSRVTYAAPEPVWAFAYLAFNAAAWRVLADNLGQDGLRTATVSVATSVGLSMAVMLTSHYRLPRLVQWARGSLWCAAPFLVGAPILAAAAQESSGATVLIVGAMTVWALVSGLLWSQFVPAPKPQRVRSIS